MTVYASFNRFAGTLLPTQVWEILTVTGVMFTGRVSWLGEKDSGVIQIQPVAPPVLPPIFVFVAHIVSARPVT